MVARIYSMTFQMNLCYIGEDNMNRFPNDTAIAIRWNEIIRLYETPTLTDRFSSRIVKLAAHLPDDEFIGWQMAVPQHGLVNFESFASAAIQAQDIQWAVDELVMSVSNINVESFNVESFVPEMQGYSDWELYEIVLPLEPRRNGEQIGFELSVMQPSANRSESFHTKWPICFPCMFGELIKVLRDHGAFFRYTVGKATVEEQSVCSRAVSATWDPSFGNVGEYVGTPVRIKVLLALPCPPSIRLRAVLGDAAPGTYLKHLGNLSDADAHTIWENPLRDSHVLPDIAARILAMEPILDGTPIIGVESCEAKARPIPARHKDPINKKSIQIGVALGATGLDRDILMGEIDLRRHWQIVGQTGTGKSTLIAKTISSNMKNIFPKFYPQSIFY